MPTPTSPRPSSSYTEEELIRNALLSPDQAGEGAWARDSSCNHNYWVVTNGAWIRYRPDGTLRVEPVEPVEPVAVGDLKMAAAKPLKIDNLLGKCKNRIFRVGVEFEGAWETLPKGVNLGHDGSVQFKDIKKLNPETGLNEAIKTSVSVGELPSEPMQPHELTKWYKRYYPQHVNDTCGMHVHMSFEKLINYSRLMVPEFQQTIIAYLKKWGEAMELPEKHLLYHRLAGKNSFCKNEFYADHQAIANKSYNQTGASRYTMINYPFAQHSTIECRVLPMFENWELALKAVQQVLDITNASLVVLGKQKEKKYQAEVVDSEEQESYYIEREVRV